MILNDIKNDFKRLKMISNDEFDENIQMLKMLMNCGL